MSRRHATELSRVCENLLADAAHTFPALVKEFERDLARLHTLVVCRGIPLFLRDLPALSKHLDRCLDNGQYVPSCLPVSGRVSGTVVIPKFLRGLYLLVFHEDGRLREDCSHDAIFFLRQILSVGKKAEVDCGMDAKISEIIAFIKCDMDVPEPGSFWDDPANHPVPDVTFRDLFGQNCDDEMSRLLGNLDSLSGLLTSTLGPYNPKDWRFKHGPGAIAELVGPSNKYCWRNWSDRLESAFPIAECGYHSLSAWAGDVDHRTIGSEDPPSRMVCVPKSYDKPRIICAEPSEHQWCQQNIWHYLETQVERTWIGGFCRFRDQSLNQELCVKGSGDGSLCTLDLSSASDRVSCQVVQALFRCNPHLLRALAASRTHHVVLPEFSNLGTHKLRKFATMGSAVTFPVETLVFLAVCLACCATKRGMRVDTRSLQSLYGEVAVFGDDLIVPKDSWDLVNRALEALGFKVNVSKSFGTGRFRESCGIDAFRGVPVTPAYWKCPVSQNAESVATNVAVHNNFYQKFLVNTARYVASTLRGRNIAYAEADSGAFGLSTRFIPPRPAVSRWNGRLHRVEFRIAWIKSSQQKLPIEDDTALLQFFTESPLPSNTWKSGVALRPVVSLNHRWVPGASLSAHDRA